MSDNLKERLTDMSVLASTRTPADALQYIEELEAEIADLKAKLEKAAKFLSYAIDMTGDPHCYHDHHGYCQAHNLEPKGECWVEQSQAFLAELTSSEAADNEVKGGKDE